MKYEFEWNDIRGLLTMINVILIICCGTSYAWIGLVVANLGLVKDLTKDKIVSSAVMHFSNIMLNAYILAGGLGH